MIELYTTHKLHLHVVMKWIPVLPLVNLSYLSEISK